MMTAKLFENGRSQAVRLPKEFRFEGDEVMIGKVGDFVVLSPKGDKWDKFMKALDMFSEDVFEVDREYQGAQERESL